MFAGRGINQRPENRKTEMKKIDIPTPEKALEYLLSLPAEYTVSLPSSGELASPEADAAGVVADMPASELAQKLGEWDWRVDEITMALRDLKA